LDRFRSSYACRRLSSFGGGEDRPFVAADLFHKGLANKVLVSQVLDDRAITIGLPGETKFDRQILLKLGVPAIAIETFGKQNKTTKDEAYALRDWAESHRAKALIVPVDIFFTRRARWMVRRAFVGTDIRIEVLSCEPS
jgi:hypothetical protein